MEENLKQAIKLFNEILEWNYSFDNQDEIKPELRDKIESFIYECKKEYSEDNKVNSKPANCASDNLKNCKMDTLLEDYKRKLKSINELISKQYSNGSIIHQRREERLNTKAAEYGTFIVDIERAMARQQQQNVSWARAEVCKRNYHWKECVTWTNDCRCINSCDLHKQT